MDRKGEKEWEKGSGGGQHVPPGAENTQRQRNGNSSSSSLPHFPEMDEWATEGGGGSDERIF